MASLKHLQNRLQEIQDKVKFEITINGVADWQIPLQRPKKLGKRWSEWCGGSEVPTITYLRKEAEVNLVSFERCVMSWFLTYGYTLEELEVEFSLDEEKMAWGKCAWYKEHPRYLEPLTDMFEKSDQRWASVINSTFKTERAGDQEFCMLSLQMLGAAFLGLRSGILLHKTLVYHKAVFSPPAPAVATAA